MAVYAQTPSAAELAQWVAQDQELQQQIASDPMVLTRLAAPAREATDRWIYRFVVLALGLTAVFVVVGVFVLKALKGDSVTILDALVALGSAVIAALAGLLAPSPASFRVSVRSVLASAARVLTPSRRARAGARRPGRYGRRDAMRSRWHRPAARRVHG